MVVWPQMMMFLPYILFFFTKTSFWSQNMVICKMKVEKWKKRTIIQILRDVDILSSPKAVRPKDILKCEVFASKHEISHQIMCNIHCVSLHLKHSFLSGTNWLTVCPALRPKNWLPVSCSEINPYFNSRKILLVCNAWIQKESGLSSANSSL